MLRYDIKRMVDWKIGQTQIIHRQMRDPNHPNPQLK